MNKTLVYICSFLGIWMLLGTIQGNAQTLTPRDSLEIRYQSIAQLEGFEVLLNIISKKNTTQDDFQDLVASSISGPRRTKLFYNPQVTAQSDLDPTVPQGSEINYPDTKEIEDYLNDFKTFYTQGSQNTIVFDEKLVSDIRYSQAGQNFFMKIKYRSTFNSPHKDKGAFPKRMRVAEFRIERRDEQWHSYISNLRFFNPTDREVYREPDAVEKEFQQLKQEGDTLLKLFEYTRASDRYLGARRLKPNDLSVSENIYQLELKIQPVKQRNLMNPTLDQYGTLIQGSLGMQNAQGDLADLYYERAQLHEKNNSMTEALEDLQQVIKWAPTYRKAYIKIGDLESRLNREDRAIEGYSKAVQLYLFPEDVSLLRKLAALERSSYDYEAARQHLTKALELDESAAGLYYELGTVLVDFGQQNSAVFNFQEAVKRDAAHAEAWYALAEAQRNLRVFSEAGKAYQKAVQLRPGWRSKLDQLLKETYVDPAIKAKNTGKLNAARNLIQTALMLDPQHKEAQKLYEELSGESSLPVATQPTTPTPSTPPPANPDTNLATNDKESTVISEPAPSRPSTSGGTPESIAREEIQYLMLRYEGSMENGDINNLEDFIMKGSKQGWKEFFVKVNNIQVTIRNPKTKFNKTFTTARLTFNQEMSYFNESKGQQENVKSSQEWRLESVNGVWEVLSVTYQ